MHAGYLQGCRQNAKLCIHEAMLKIGVIEGLSRLLPPKQVPLLTQAASCDLSSVPAQQQLNDERSAAVSCASLVATEDDMLW